jgi:hypothetical protein
MRPKPPKIVTDYFNAKNIAVPKCCHTCWYYNEKGFCKAFEQSPPEHFASEVDACQQWEQDVPF